MRIFIKAALKTKKMGKYGYYSISFVDLLGMLTYDLDKFASTRLFMPELLSLLKDIRLETLSEKEFTKNLSLFSLEELKALGEELDFLIRV